jgi:hypothetical protein
MKNVCQWLLQTCYDEHVAGRATHWRQRQHSTKGVLGEQDGARYDPASSPRSVPTELLASLATWLWGTLCTDHQQKATTDADSFYVTGVVWQSIAIDVHSAGAVAVAA